MSVYTFTKAEVSLGQLEAAILASNIPHDSLGCTNTGEAVDNLLIEMSDALTGAEETALASLVTAHTPVEVIQSLQVRCIEMSFAGAGGTALKSNLETYTTLASFIFQGVLNVGDVSRVSIGVHVDNNVTGSIRIWDRDTGLVVGEEVGIVNNELAIISMEPINNLPLNESILEIQIKGTGGNKKAAAYLHCLTMYFD